MGIEPSDGEKMTKILVTGSRGFNDYNLVLEFFNNYEGHIEEIIHGGAIGADSLAEKYAKQHNIISTIIRPIPSSKKEYYLHRNAEMVALCDECVVFWDGKSRGTLFTMNYAKKRGKKTTLIEKNSRLE